MSPRSERKAAVRAYGITPWGRAFCDVVESGADHRHITGARRYFREHHVDALDIGPDRITSSVRGSQLDPFEVVLTTRSVDPATVVHLLQASGETAALLALARGEQPPALGELIAPTESADVTSSCTCPDEAPRCIHVLATAFEVADRIDRHPVTLLRVMGTDLPDLLALAQDSAERGLLSTGSRSEPSGSRSGPAGSTSGDPAPGTPLHEPGTPLHEPGTPLLEPVERDFYGDRSPVLAPPSFPAMDPIGELELTGLRAALRASGVGATQVAEALDDLAELYAVLRDPR
ncbi:MAG: hypothetical protein QM774_07420 [Gordonia sp. (in: high G+C Gram-positive bacteria)]|uniref:SWIM zinc finger family protein n=1 Tax=Gordonia sp. (in: high G+C Gram-positive bacteria) TaxID=84139 RepID=UPI0039E2607F